MFLFYRWENQDTTRLNVLPKVTQLMNCRPWILNLENKYELLCTTALDYTYKTMVIILLCWKNVLSKAEGNFSKVIFLKRNGESRYLGLSLRINNMERCNKRQIWTKYVKYKANEKHYYIFINTPKFISKLGRIGVPSTGQD